MAGLTPTTMLFIRNAEGISHHPDERVEVADVEAVEEVGALAAIFDYDWSYA